MDNFSERFRRHIERVEAFTALVESGDVRAQRKMRLINLSLLLFLLAVVATLVRRLFL